MAGGTEDLSLSAPVEGSPPLHSVQRPDWIALWHYTDTSRSGEPGHHIPRAAICSRQQPAPQHQTPPGSHRPRHSDRQSMRMDRTRADRLRGERS